MKHPHLYLITKTHQLVHAENITDEPPSRVILQSPNSNTLFNMYYVIYTHTCTDTQYIQMHCGDLALCNNAALLFFPFHLLPFESFHIEYLAALALLQMLLHWVDGGELCLTEQPLALLQSKRLTAVFFHHHLASTCFNICRLLQVDQQRHRSSQNSHILSHIQTFFPLVDLPYMSIPFSLILSSRLAVYQVTDGFIFFKLRLVCNVLISLFFSFIAALDH